MKKKLLSAFFAAALFASCTGFSGRRIQNFTQTPEAAEKPESFIIIEHKNKSSGGSIPEWVEAWLNSGVPEVEKLNTYHDRYVFIIRNEGNNFNALTQWQKGFSPELDFPRLAAARIEARFSASVPFPDNEYGSFYETLVRTAADSSWTGAVREDDFWIRREFPPQEFTAGNEEDVSSAGAASSEASGQGSVPVKEAWQFLILVTINKSLFASQLDGIFRSVNPKPSPSREQTNAANRIKERFFDGF